METFSALLALCEGNSRVTGEFFSQRPVARSFDVSFDLRMNKRLSKPSTRRWFETSPWSLWRHCNEWIQCAKGLHVCESLLVGACLGYCHGYCAEGPWTHFPKIGGEDYHHAYISFYPTTSLYEVVKMFISLLNRIVRRLAAETDIKLLSNWNVKHRFRAFEILR